MQPLNHLSKTISSSDSEKRQDNEPEKKSENPTCLDKTESVGLSAISALKDLNEEMKNFNEEMRDSVNESMSSLEKGLESLRCGCENGMANTHFKMAQRYLNGPLGQKNVKEAIKFLRLGADSNHPEAQYALGKIYFDEEYDRVDHIEAHKWFGRAAALEHVEAQCMLDMMYSKGLGVKVNEEEAAIWCERAALQGHEVAQYNLATRYYLGNGVSMDFEKAAKWYKLGAGRGCAESQCSLGIIYFDGLLCVKAPPSNDNESVSLLLTKTGNHSSSLDLSQPKENNDMISSDSYDPQYQEAYKWFSLAAEQNNAEAQCYLGEMYMEGLGVEKDISKAHAFFKNSAKNGYKRAKVLLNRYADLFLNKQENQKKLENQKNQNAEFYQKIKTISDKPKPVTNEEVVEKFIEEHFEKMFATEAVKKIIEKKGFISIKGKESELKLIKDLFTHHAKLRKQKIQPWNAAVSYEKGQLPTLTISWSNINTISDLFKYHPFITDFNRLLEKGTKKNVDAPSPKPESHSSRSNGRLYVEIWKKQLQNVVCGAKVEGNENGSLTIDFSKMHRESSNLYEFSVKSKGEKHGAGNKSLLVNSSFIENQMISRLKKKLALQCGAGHSEQPHKFTVTPSQEKPDVSVCKKIQEKITLRLLAEGQMSPIEDSLPNKEEAKEVQNSRFPEFQPNEGVQSAKKPEENEIPTVEASLFKFLKEFTFDEFKWLKANENEKKLIFSFHYNGVSSIKINGIPVNSVEFFMKITAFTNAFLKKDVFKCTKSESNGRKIVYFSVLKDEAYNLHDEEIIRSVKEKIQESMASIKEKTFDEENIAALFKTLPFDASTESAIEAPAGSSIYETQEKKLWTGKIKKGQLPPLPKTLQLTESESLNMFSLKLLQLAKMKINLARDLRDLREWHFYLLRFVHEFRKSTFRYDSTEYSFLTELRNVLRHQNLLLNWEDNHAVLMSITHLGLNLIAEGVNKTSWNKFEYKVSEYLQEIRCDLDENTVISTEILNDRINAEKMLLTELHHSKAPKETVLMTASIIGELAGLNAEIPWAAMENCCRDLYRTVGHKIENFDAQAETGYRELLKFLN